MKRMALRVRESSVVSRTKRVDQNAVVVIWRKQMRREWTRAVNIITKGKERGDAQCNDQDDEREAYVRLATCGNKG